MMLPMKMSVKFRRCEIISCFFIIFIFFKIVVVDNEHISTAMDCVTKFTSGNEIGEVQNNFKHVSIFRFHFAVRTYQRAMLRTRNK